MKRLLLISALLVPCAMAQATSSNNAYDNLSKGTQIIAKRLASKNLTEVVVIAMKLQIECQQLNSKDVCEGVKNILTVLDARVAASSAPNDDPSIAFVRGLMEGVNEANQEIIGTINDIR